MGMRKKATKPKSASTTVAAPVVSSSRLLRWGPALLLLLVTILAYQPVWHAGFIWDDDEYITNNLTLRSWDGLRQIWLNLTATPQYYPLVHTSFWLEYQFWGSNPLGHHVVNVLLHALVAVLLWRLFWRLQLPAAWLVAGVFALHPVMVESVAWVTERKNVLSAVFYLSAASAWWHWTELRRDSQRQGTSLQWYFLAFLLFLAALLSKTVTASLPAALLLVIWWKHGRITGRDAWPLLPFFAAGLLMGLVTSWLERTHVGAQGPAWAFSFSERCLIAGRAVWFYAAKLLWPENLTFIYPRWGIYTAVWWQWVFPLSAMAVVAGLWNLRQRIGRGPLTAVLFFGGTLLPALGFINIYPMRYSFVADHFQYLACLGLLVLVSVGVETALRKKPFQFHLFCSALLLTLGVLTWRQCRMYADAETLWRTTIEHNPASWLAQNNLGGLLLRKGNLAEAVIHINQAIALEPDYPEAYNNLGNALLQTGFTDQAIVQYQKALAINANYPEARDNLGAALLKLGRVDEAAVEFQKVLAIQPNNATARYNLGTALLQKGQVDEAISELQKALAIEPDYADARGNLGFAFLRRGRPDEAIVQFQKALAIRPDYPEARANLGNALFQQGRLNEAILQLQNALALQPGSLAAQDTLTRIAWALATSPDSSVRNGVKAVELAEQVDRLAGGKNPVAAATLAAACAETGKFPEAVAHVQRAIQLAGSQNNAAAVAALEAQLKLYQAGSPFRDTGASP